MKEQYKVCEEKMKKCIESLNREYISIRSGRANASILDKVKVDYYGTMTPINQLGSISVSDARNLVIQPWDLSAMALIEKAINTSDIGINPTNDGKVIRLSFPPLNEERRKEIVKTIHKMAEESKVTIRNIRRDVLDKFKLMKKDSEITEDDLKSIEKDVQNLTDKYCKECESMCLSKEKDILSI